MSEANSISVSRRKMLIAAAAVAVPAVAYPLYRRLEGINEAKNRELKESFELESAKYREIDRSLIGYRETGSIDVGIDGTRAMAVERSGNLIVSGGKGLRRMNMKGAVLKEVDLSDRGWAVAADADGKVYVALRDRVEVLGAELERLTSWPALPAGTHLTSIAIAEDAVYLADAGRRLVVRCDRTGKVLGEIGRPDASRGLRGFVVPSPNMDVAVGPEAELWVANPGCHRLESYKPDGTLSRYWGSPVGGVAGFFGCCGPSDFAILPDGAFITSEKSIARIKRHHADGRLDVLVADPRTFGEASSGIELAVTPSGDILAMERGMRTVRVFEALLPGKEADHVTRVD